MRRFFVLFFSAASGYISLTQEMLWMRAVSYLTGGSPAVFAHVLGFFLIGVALGALFAERLCERRFTRPESSPVRFVGAMLIISALFYYVSIALTAKLLTVSAALGMVAIYVVVTVVSFLLGGVFPVLCHYGTRAGQQVGLAVSRLYLANIVGCTLGPLLTGFVLMEYLPTDRIILGISLVTLLLGGAAFLFDRPRQAPLPAAAALLGIAALYLAHPILYEHLLERLHYGTSYNPSMAYKELIQERSGIIAVQRDWANGADTLYGGGMYDGNFNVDPVLDVNTITRAYMIAALHPRPEEVLEVGLASGSWSRVMAAYGPVKRHVIVEISPGYLGLIGQYLPQKDLLVDPKVNIAIDDGRRWLKRHPEQKFDFILQNTTWHFRSSASNLLSVEYFRMCKEHLKSGGVIYVNTTQSQDVAYTAAQVFAHAVRYKSFIAASDASFDLKPDQIRTNLLKFKFDDKAMFDTTDRHLGNVAEDLATADLSDIGPSLRSRADLRVITDDNMLTEYKRQWLAENNASNVRLRERGRIFDSQRTWGAFLRAWNGK
jgi:spermidine synthase